MTSNAPAILSPLMEQARNCYLNRRKHSKRIKKLARRVAREEPGDLRLRRVQSAPEGHQSDVVRVLTKRQIPPFLMELVLKKRIFNIGSIKKMAISLKGEKVELPSLSFMTQHCRRQEQELQGIVSENRQRFEEIRRNTEALALARRAAIAILAEPDPYSSTMSLDSISHNSYDVPDYQSHSHEDVHHPTNMLDFNEPIDTLQSSHRESIFMTMF